MPLHLMKMMPQVMTIIMGVMVVPVGEDDGDDAERNAVYNNIVNRYAG